LYKNYPTGSLLIWKTKNPPKLRKSEKIAEGVYAKIILDGQQRLTALYTIIKGKSPPYYEKKNLFFNLYFNVETEEFAYYQPLKMKDKKEWISVVEFFKYSGAGNFIEKFDQDLQKYYLEHLSKLNRLDAIRRYEYYVDEDKLKPDLELREVVKIFNLVNKQGRTLQENDLALAHLCIFWPEIKDLFREEIQKISKKSFKFDLSFMVLCLNSIASGHAKFDYIYDLSEDRIRESWEKLKKSLEYLINILHDKAYIISTEPYELKTDALLVPILVYLSQNNYEFGSEEILNKFLYWFYAALMWGRYTRRGKSAPLEQDVVTITRENNPDALIENFKREVKNFEVSLKNLEGAPVTSPLFNMAFVVAKSKGAVDWFNGIRLHSGLVGKAYKLNKHHIFPKGLLRERGYYKDRESRKMVNEIANRAFLTERVNKEISSKEPSIYFETVLRKYPNALEQQFIPNNKELWKIENFDDFLRKRREIIANEINRFMESLLEKKETALDVSKLINEDESYNLEFKSTFAWNLKESRYDKDLKFSVLKTVLAFMNTNGGILLIGVDDTGKVIGLDYDYKANWKGNKDGFLLELRNYIQNTIGLNNYNRYISVDFQNIDNKEICIVQVEKSLDPIFIKKDGRKILYVRLDNQTKPLDDPEEIKDYIDENWK